MLKFIANLFTKKVSAPAPYKVEAPEPKAKKPAAKKATVKKATTRKPKAKA